MGLLCCGSLGKVGEMDNTNGDPNLILDVEKVLADSAWRSFKISYGKWERRFLDRKKFTIEVPMNYFHFEEVEKPKVMAKDCPQGIDVSQEAPKPKLVAGMKSPQGIEPQGLESGCPQGMNVIQTPLSDRKNVAERQTSMRDMASSNHIGLETEFNNDTDEQQTYTFQFEKVRTAAVEVSYQKGYSIGGRANFSIGLPSVFGDGSVGFEVEKQLQVTKASGERFEESLKTSATSNIVVSKRSRYTASVVMEERNLVAEFKIVMRMTMPAKCAPIYIKENKTGEVIFCRTINNLPRIFKDFKGVTAVGPRLDAVDFTIEGIISGVRLASHKINLYSHPKPAPANTERDLLCVQEAQDEALDESPLLLNYHG